VSQTEVAGAKAGRGTVLLQGQIGRHLHLVAVENGRGRGSTLRTPRRPPPRAVQRPGRNQILHRRQTQYNGRPPRRAHQGIRAGRALLQLNLKPSREKPRQLAEFQVTQVRRPRRDRWRTAQQVAALPPRPFRRPPARSPLADPSAVLYQGRGVGGGDRNVNRILCRESTD